MKNEKLPRKRDVDIFICRLYYAKASGSCVTDRVLKVHICRPTAHMPSTNSRLGAGDIYRSIIYAIYRQIS